MPLQLHRNGAFAASVEVVAGKARSAACFRKDTGALEDAANVDGGKARTALLSAPSVVLMRGGVPIVVDGRVVGSIGVSGVAAEQDEQVARAGAKAVAGP